MLILVQRQAAEDTAKPTSLPHRTLYFGRNCWTLFAQRKLSVGIPNKIEVLRRVADAKPPLN